MPADENSTLVEKILNAWPVERWNEFHVVVAVSGGADSVALLRALHQIKSELTKPSTGSLFVAHYNHKLRGADSDGDAAFVSELAANLKLGFHAGSGASNVASSSENDFREERYEFLFDVARKTNSRYIVTAHHRDDQVETVLFRVFRGTGIGGLQGIPLSRVVDESLTIVRPMLDVKRTTIDAALDAWGQSYRNDVSNQQSKYARNFLRNEVLPLLRERFASADDSVVRLSKQATEQQAFLREQMMPLFQFVSERDNGVTIECGSLRGQSPVLLRELFSEIFRRNSWPVSQLGFRELDHLARLVVSNYDVPRFQLPGMIDCRKDGRLIRLTRNRNRDQ